MRLAIRTAGLVFLILVENINNLIISSNSSSSNSNVNSSSSNGSNSSNNNSNVDKESNLVTALEVIKGS